MSPSQEPFTIPIQVRYADIDSLQHVNNARYFTFMEQARASYFAQLDLWDGRDMRRLGIILARTSCDYLKPIRYGDTVQVKTQTVELGRKSFRMRYEITGDRDEIYAAGEASLVCFDYDKEQTIPIPNDWRQKIAEYEGIEKLRKR